MSVISCRGISDMLSHRLSKMELNEYSVRSELGYIELTTTMAVATHSHEVVGYDPSGAFIERTDFGDTDFSDPALLELITRELDHENLTKRAQRGDESMIEQTIPLPIDTSPRLGDSIVESVGMNDSEKISDVRNSPGLKPARERQSACPSTVLRLTDPQPEDQMLHLVSIEGVTMGGDHCRRELRTVRERRIQRLSGLT